MARPQKQGLKTKTVAFRITQEIDDAINEYVAYYNKKFKMEKKEKWDRSHVVRCALEDYFETYYKKIL